MRPGASWALVCLAASATAVLGQEAAPSGAEPLTLSEAVERARTSHPALVAAGARLEAADAAVREAAGGRLPFLATEATAMRYAEPMVVAPLHGFDPGSPPTFDRTLVQAHLSLGHTLFDGGAVAARTDGARALAGSAAAGATAAEQDLLAEVAKAYLRAGAARERVAAESSRVRALDEERARAEGLLREGRTARVSVLRAEAALAWARAEATLAEEQADVAARRLARLMGVDATEVAPRPLASLAVATPVPSREALLRDALEGSPGLSRARSGVDAAESAWREARARWLPAVRLTGRWVEYGSGAGTFEGEWQGGLQVSWPVFTGGARAAAAERAAAGTRAARADVDVAELAVADAVDAALAALSGAAARVSALETAVAQGAEVARIERLALQEGAGVQTDYIAAEAELLGARAALAEARAESAAARIELARVAGALSPEWLAQNLEASP